MLLVKIDRCGSAESPMALAVPTYVKLVSFYHATLAAHASIVLADIILSLSVCLSVTLHCRYFDTTRKGNHSSFLTPTVVDG